MINARRRKPRIAQISALITIRTVNVGSMRLQQYVESLPGRPWRKFLGKSRCVVEALAVGPAAV
jgi:hypothetical protein